MRKAGDSKIYPRNSNAILISLKSYDHREVGGRSYALRWEAAGEGGGSWLGNRPCSSSRSLSLTGIEWLGRVVKHVDYLRPNYLNY